MHNNEQSIDLLTNLWNVPIENSSQIKFSREAATPVIYLVSNQRLTDHS